MGLGTDLAREEAPEHAELIDNFKDQLLIVFLKRLGGKAEIPVHEVDDTGNDLFFMSINNGKFQFEIKQKS